MPLPLLFIGIAALAGSAGVGAGAKGGYDQYKAAGINKDSNKRVEIASSQLEQARIQCGESLQSLGQEKIFILNKSVRQFLNYFEQIKNVDFRDSVGLMELNKMHIDQKDFEELGNLANLALSLGSGTVAGAISGAATAFGAYSAASALATASTGTAIATLHGAAATNATLAFFGGGSLASGGLGIAGGTAVLGGLVAGPALLVMGVIVGAEGGKQLEKAKANAAEADEICQELENGTVQCIAIRRRTSMFYNLLARLDARLYPMLDNMKNVIDTEGIDYSKYSAEAKKTIVLAASTAVAIKAVLDTPILSEEGGLTEESLEIFKKFTHTLDD